LVTADGDIFSRFAGYERLKNFQTRGLFLAKDKRNAAEAAELRFRAEYQLRARTAEARLSRTDAESQRLLHELEVHQIELEMQNEELRKARDEREALLEKYADLYDFAPVGYFTLDRDGIIRAANLTGASILRIERSLLLGRRFDSFLSPAVRLNFIPFLEKVFSSMDKVACEVPLKKNGKRSLHVQIDAVASASATECRLAVIDITARWETEKELLESEKRYASLFNNRHVAMLLIDPETGAILKANPAACSFYGYSAEQFASMSICDLTTLTQKDILGKMARALEIGTSLFHFQHRLANDEFREVEVYCGPIEIKERKLLYSIVHDVTERIRIEEKVKILHSEIAAHASELEAVNFELEAFNYMVAHDLRSPLASINGFCQVVQKVCAAHSEDCKSYIREIYEASLRMDSLIDALLVFSRVKCAGICHTRLDLSEMANEVAKGLQFLEPERRVTFRIAAGIVANGDAKLMRIVLDNLIGNAWKYTGKRKKAIIVFGLSKTEREQICFVRDNGTGFDNAYAEKLFVPFQRLPGSNEFKGHGIGLATVERIIRRHGERVWAESELGKGATFYFTLTADRDSS
jgi:PAS domain S-box-containing protein